VKDNFPGAAGPIVVHRLDMDTSGILLLALDADAQRNLSRQFEARTVEKSYTALVEDRVPFEHGTIDLSLRADLDNRPVQIVDPVDGRPAQTRWRVLAYETDRTRLELVPLTGRTHQLRVHCAHPGPGGLGGPHAAPARPGHPILGDVLYGDAASAPRLMLHANLLIFTDPATGTRTRVASTVPF
jgi:tRNA pseudouridine32 synthase/23S rRNA pseudouridine746 synthase